MRRIAIAVAAVALFGAVAGCGGDDEGAITTGVAETGAERMDVSGEDIVELAQHDEFFKPAIFEGTPGQTLTIDLKNEGEAAHTFTITEKEVDEEVQPGDVGQVRVTFPRSGKLAFKCRYHESVGMVGALEVSSSPMPTTTTPSTTTTSDY